MYTPQCVDILRLVRILSAVQSHTCNSRVKCWGSQTHSYDQGVALPRIQWRSPLPPASLPAARNFIPTKQSMPTGHSSLSYSFPCVLPLGAILKSGVGISFRAPGLRHGLGERPGGVCQVLRREVLARIGARTSIIGTAHMPGAVYHLCI